MDTAPALNDWIAHLPDGTQTNPTILSFPAAGCYDIEESLYLPKRNWLYVDGNGTAFKMLTNGTTGPTLYTGQVAPITDRAAFYIDEGTNLTWHDVSISGPNNCTLHPYYNCYTSKYESQSGFRVIGATNLTLDSVNVSHVWGDFVEIDGDATNYVGFSRYITVKNSSGDHLGRHALTSEGVQDSTFVDNTWSTVAYDGVDMEIECQTYCATGPNSSGRYSGSGEVNDTVSNNTFTDVGEVWAAISGPGLVNNVTFSGNRIHEGDSGDGLNFYVNPSSYQSSSTRYSNINLINNVADSLMWSSRGNVELTNVDGAVISGNTYPHDNQPGGACSGKCAYSTDIWSSTNVSIQHNTSLDDPYFLQVDGPTANGAQWTGAPSANVSSCGNEWGDPKNPTRSPVC